MKQTTTTKLFTSVAILLLIMGFVNSKKWFSLESKEYNFKIEFPAEPTENPQIVDSEIGELKLNMFIYETPENGNDDNLVYLVNCTEYPDSVINSDISEILSDFFRNSIDGAVGSVSGNIISENVIQINDFPGREIKIEFQEGAAIMSLKMFLVKNRMYMLQVITESKNDSNKSIARFMDSFELMNAGGQ